MQIFLRVYCLLVCLCLPHYAQANLPFLDLIAHTPTAIVETRKVCISDFPNAYNPSIVRWKEGWLMSFRQRQKVNSQWVSLIGLVILDSSFQPTGKAQLLCTDSIYSADPRLLWVGKKLYMVYNDRDQVDSVHPISLARMCVGRLREGSSGFFLSKRRRLTQFAGQRGDRAEKNWVPPFGWLKFTHALF